MKQISFRGLVAFAAAMAFSVLSAQEVTTEEATSVTQTHATLTASFAEGSTANGFQYKYGELVPLSDFASHVLTSVSDPVAFTMSGAKNFYWREAKGWAETEQGLASGQQSVLTTTFTLTQATAIEFEWCTDSEEGKTVFSFLVDGEVTDYSVSGLQDNPNRPNFKHVTHTIAAGEHTVTWRFSKTGDTSTGGDIGILRNICIRNTTPGVWHTASASSPSHVVRWLYPSQKYLWRAFSVVNGDSIFSSLKEFETLGVSIGDVSVKETSQTTATLTGTVTPGDAWVGKGFIVTSGNHREQLDAFGKALVSYACVPLAITHDTQWKAGTDYIYNTTTSDGKTVVVSFTLPKATTISFTLIPQHN